MHDIVLLVCFTVDKSKNGGNRAIVFLVETSNLKKPTDTSLGGPLNVRISHDSMIATLPLLFFSLCTLIFVLLVDCLLTLYQQYFLSLLLIYPLLSSNISFIPLLVYDLSPPYFSHFL